MRRNLTVSGPNAGRRVDAFLRLELASVPRHTLMKWLRTGVVRVNGKKVKPETRLAEGDEIGMPVLEGDGRKPSADRREPKADGRSPSADLREPKADGRSPSADRREPKSDGRQPSADRRPPRRRARPDLTIIYEDDDLLIVDKPAHLPAHAGTGHTDSLDARVLAYLDAENAPVGHKPGLVQRLDSGVSGLVPVGKHAGALRVLAAAVAKDGIRKIYQGVVIGEVGPASGEIRIPLRVDDQPFAHRPRTHPDANGLPAHTTWTRVEALRQATLLDIEIHTGRTHQIRAHLRAINHPLIGDRRYGNVDHDTLLGARIDRPALHARRLLFTHPSTGVALTFDAPLPQDMVALLAALRRR